MCNDHPYKFERSLLYHPDERDATVHGRTRGRANREMNQWVLTILAARATCLGESTAPDAQIHIQHMDMPDAPAGPCIGCVISMPMTEGVAVAAYLAEHPKWLYWKITPPYKPPED